MDVKLGKVYIRKCGNNPIDINILNSVINVHGYLPETDYSDRKKAVLLVLETLYNEVQEMEIL